jgi:hypothetical protein
MNDVRVRFGRRIKRVIVEATQPGITPAYVGKTIGGSFRTTLFWVALVSNAVAAPCDGLQRLEREKLVRLRIENAKLKQAQEALARSVALFISETPRKEDLFAFVKANQANYSVGMMCRLLQVSRSGFYAWVNRPVCARKREDFVLTRKIAAIHNASNRAFGAPTIHAELAAAHGIHVGRKRVARLMRAAGLRGIPRKRQAEASRFESASTQPELAQLTTALVHGKSDD